MTDEFAIIPVGGSSGEKEYKYVPGSGPFGGDTRAGTVFGDQPVSSGTGKNERVDVVDREVKDDSGVGRPDGTRGAENRTIHVLDRDTNTYKDIDEKDYDPKKHMKDVVDGVVTEVEVGEVEKMSKDEFLELVKDARIPNSEYNKGGVNKTKRDNARQKLREEEVNVDYITCRDLPGGDRAAKDRRSERNDEIDSLMEAISTGEVTNEQRDRLLSEDIRLTQEMLDGWNVEINDNVEIEIDAKEERERIISENENLFRELFFADFDQNVWRRDFDEISELWKNLNDDGVLREMIDSGYPYRARNANEDFSLLREAYMRHLFGEETWRQLNEDRQNLNNTESYLRSPISEQRELAEKTLRYQRPSLENKVKSKTRGVGNGRGWQDMDSALAGEYLLKYFELNESISGNNFDLVFKIFSTKYLEIDYIGADINEAISREKNQELLKSIRKVHELAVNLDLTSTKVFENIKQENVEGVDVGVFNMLKLKKEINDREIAVVPLAMEEYDGVLREIYQSGDLAVNIDSPEVYSRVDEILSSKIPNESERRLIMKMARDLCRITGLDAQFGFAEQNKTVKLGSTVRGSFLRGLLCFNDSLKGELPPEKQTLAGGIDIGAYSFWNKMRNPSVISFKTDSLYASEIEQIANEKLSTGEAHLQNWLNGLKKPSEAKKAESDFIENPTLANFVSRLVEAYGYKEEKRPVYLKIRLDACMSYFKRYGEGTAKIIRSVTELFMKDGNFDGKNIFLSAGDLKSYFNGFGIPINTTKAVLEDDSRNINAWLDRHFLGRK